MSIKSSDIYRGDAITLKALDSGFVEMIFDLQDSPINKFNTLTVNELGEAIALLKKEKVLGLLITSAKPTFIVGADITEFPTLFNQIDGEGKQSITKTSKLFTELENLPFPTVAAINGLALGGGFELALAADFRVLAEDGVVGLPEVTLGICPGWGGTVRLSRLVGIDTSLAWMMSGKAQKATSALEKGAVDKVSKQDDLREVALTLLSETLSEGDSENVTYKEVRTLKQKPVNASLTSEEMLSEIRATYTVNLNPNYPAASEILNLVLTHAKLPAADAISLEIDTLMKLATGDVAKSLIGQFINDQYLNKKAKGYLRLAQTINQAAVLGAGIMGGGIAFQSASTGTPVLMKDINQQALELGIETAEGLLDKKINKGRLDEAGKEKVINMIKPTLEYDDFDKVDYVVEAVVENVVIKTKVLVEIENVLADDAVLTSNTSTICIDTLAGNLQRPEQFCGMHFFNPVHAMPLVEIIRGRQTSKETVATAVAYAISMGKTPIVVNDCPGFLVNRILFPYFNGFNLLLKDGVDWQRIDRVMEDFGWPMGPAYLSDVIGIDTLDHADKVMEEGFPERMRHAEPTFMDGLAKAGMFGQKSGEGYYTYNALDGNKQNSERSKRMFENFTKAKKELSDQDIVNRLMVPMCLEAVRCLEDGVVATAAEIDTALVLGLGFPRFRGGAIRYIDTVGLDKFAAMAREQASYGPLFELTDSFLSRLNAGNKYY